LQHWTQVQECNLVKILKLTNKGIIFFLVTARVAGDKHLSEKLNYYWHERNALFSHFYLLFIGMPIEDKR